MPWPKSSISLSMTSASPSTLATPSPISRMMPTLCLAAAALAPAICASISCTRSAIASSPPRTSQPCLERRQAGPHAVVVHIAADPDPHPADERGILGEGRFESRPYTRARPAWMSSRMSGTSGVGALDERPCAGRYRVAPAAGSPTGWPARRGVWTRRCRCATWRARPSSSTPLTRQSRNSCRAARLTFRFAFIVPVPSSAGCWLAARRAPRRSRAQAVKCLAVSSARRR